MRRARTERRTSRQKLTAPWMLTYSDLMTLLLTFFILVASLSSIEVTKFKKAFASLRGALGVLPEKVILKPERIPLPDLTDFQRTLIMRTLQGMSRFISDRGMDDAIQLKLTSKGIAIRISNPLLFELGEAELKPEILPVLGKLAALTREWSYRIRVEGHTDDLPIHTPRYPSNWELSAARALNVVKYFVARGLNPAKLSAVGYGEFRPIAPNDSDEHRTLNRRVEIFIEYDESEGEIGADGTKSLPPEEDRDGER